MLNLIKNCSSTTPVRAVPASLGFGLWSEHETERLGVCKSRAPGGYPAAASFGLPFQHLP